MILLPSPPRRAWLISFWLVISLGIGLFTGVLLGVWLEPRLFAWGLVCALGLAVPGVFWPRWVVAKPYAGWNKVALLFAQCARPLLLGLCYYVTFVVVGWSGSPLAGRRPHSPDSLWTARDGCGSCAGPDGAGRHWTRDYCVWALRSGNRWALCLLPFLFILRQLHTGEKDQDVPAHTYTLF